MKKIIILLCLSICLFTSCITTNINVVSNDVMPLVESTLPVIRLQIGEKNGLFLIDTGASSSYIATEYLDKVGYYKPKESTEQFSSINSKVEYQTSYVLVRIDNIEYKFKTISMSAINKALPTEIIGIIGYNFLKDNKMVIDFKENKVYKSTNKISKEIKSTYEQIDE